LGWRGGRSPSPRSRARGRRRRDRPRSSGRRGRRRGGAGRRARVPGRPGPRPTWSGAWPSAPTGRRGSGGVPPWRKRSSEPSCDVGLGTLVRGPREELLGGPEFDQVAEVEEAGKVRGARRLLHVVRHDENRIALFQLDQQDRKSTRLNSSHVAISYAVFCLKKKKRLLIYY